MSDDLYESLLAETQAMGAPTPEDQQLLDQLVQESAKGYGPPTEPGRRARINTAAGQGRLQQLLTGAGYGLTKAGRGLEEAYLKLFGTNQELEDLQKQIKMEEKTFADISNSEWNPRSGYLKGGVLAGQVLPGLALPTPQSKTMAARAALNALIGGGYEGLTTTGSIGDRLGISDFSSTGGGALVGAIGGGVGSVGADLVTKGVSGLRGLYTQPEAVAVADRLRKHGLKPRLGDIAKPGTAKVIKSLENLADTADDVEDLRRLIVPDRVGGRNVVSEAVKQTETALQQRADDIWSPFKTFVSQNTVPTVRPTNLRTGLMNVLKHDKTFLNNIADDVLRGKLEKLLLNTKNKGIPAEEYVELQSALSGLTPYIKSRAQPAPGSPMLADKQAYKRFAENIMEGLRKDWEVWKSYKGPEAKEAKRLLEESMGTWKKEILPWNQSDVAFKLKEIDRHAAPETASILSVNPDIDATQLVADYVRKYGPYDAADPIDALLAMNRQGSILSKTPEEIPVLGALSATTKGLASHLPSVSRRPGFQKWYLGDPRMESALAEGWRRLGVNIGREYGQPIGVTGAALQSLLGGHRDGGMNSDEPGVGMPISMQNQIGAAGR